MWWKCSICNHEWKTSLKHRVNGSGCPECAKNFKTSIPELTVFFFIKKYFNDAISSYNDLGFELDIYIPSLKVGIEYDGETWHKNIKKDSLKNLKCKENDIELIRIREPNCCKITEVKTFICEDLSFNALEKVILNLLNYLNLSVDKNEINIKLNLNNIYKLVSNSKIKNSLGEIYPNLISWWDCDKNENLSIFGIKPNSHKITFWKCPFCGFTWRNITKDEIKRKKCSSCHKKR